jgi:hypothetical protein
MIRRREFASAGLTAAALAAMEAVGAAYERKPEAGASPESMFDKCARACSDCQRLCDACATYCAKLLAKGSEHHLETLDSCRDCASLCSSASQIVAREGMFADLVCRACEEACARCASHCERHGQSDPMMTRCAEECRKCETACREMLAQALPGRK